MDYIELLKNINYFSFITAFAKWIFLAILLSTLLLIVATKLKLFKRRTRIARILVKGYYIVIPLYFMFLAVKIAPIRNSQLELNRAIENNKEIATEFTYDFLSKIVSDSLLSQEISAKDIVNSYLNKYVYAVDTANPKSKLNVTKRVIYKVKRKIEYSFLTRLVESKIVKEASGSVGLSGRTGNALYRTDLKSLFTEGEIIDIFTRELNRIYRYIYKSMLLVFAIGLLIPTAEIIIAKIVKY